MEDFKTFSYEILFDLEKSCKDSTEFPQALRSAFLNVHLSRIYGTFITTENFTLAQVYSLYPFLHSELISCCF